MKNLFIILVAFFICLQFQIANAGIIKEVAKDAIIIYGATKIPREVYKEYKTYDNNQEAASKQGYCRDPQKSKKTAEKLSDLFHKGITDQDPNMCED